MTNTPLKPSLPPAARGGVPTGVRYASQESVDALSKKVDTLAEKMDEILTLLKSPPPTPLPPVSLPSVASLANSTREIYEACRLAIDEKSQYADKECRAVVIGSVEGKTPAERLERDQKMVAELVSYCESAEVQQALNDGKVNFHRHPVDKPPKSRPLKIQFADKTLRDQFLNGIRLKKGRPPPLVSPSSFVRKDLTPTQLTLEREARKEAVAKNITAGKLVYGVRDFSLITYRTHRPLPPDYGMTHESRTLSRAADHPSAGSLSPSSTPLAAALSSTPSMPKSDNVTTRSKATVTK